MKLRLRSTSGRQALVLEAGATVACLKAAAGLVDEDRLSLNNRVGCHRRRDAGSGRATPRRALQKRPEPALFVCRTRYAASPAPSCTTLA